MRPVNALLVLSLAAAFAVVASTRIRSCAARNFQQFLQCKIKNIYFEMSELRQTVKECCNENECMYDGQTRAHGSIFTAVDDCNACVCNSGSVECTNATACPADPTVNYKDVIAQGYCAAKAFNGDHVSAVRRDCEGDGNTTCSDICGFETQFSSEIGDSFPGLGGFGCRGSLWVWFDHPRLAPNPGPAQTDPGLLNMVTISYSGCAETGCGPNYCCCWGGAF